MDDPKEATENEAHRSATEKEVHRSATEIEVRRRSAMEKEAHRSATEKDVHRSATEKEVQCCDVAYPADNIETRDTADILAKNTNQKSSPKEAPCGSSGIDSESSFRYSGSSGTTHIPSKSTVSLTANLKTDSTTTGVDRSCSDVFTGRRIVDMMKEHLTKQNAFALWRFLSQYERVNTSMAVGVSSLTSGGVEHRVRATRDDKIEPSRSMEQNTDTLHATTKNTGDPEQHKAAVTIQSLHYRFTSSCIPQIPFDVSVCSHTST
jgi:hypothetical protein